jgi:hypothetical protein
VTEPLKPRNSPDRAEYLVYHELLLTSQIFASTPDSTEHTASLIAEPHWLFLEAAISDRGRPLTRIKAARKAIRLLLSGDWARARDIGRAAMLQLPFACGRHLPLQDQQEAIAETSFLADETCSLLLQPGVESPEEVLRQLEAGESHAIKGRHG